MEFHTNYDLTVGPNLHPPEFTCLENAEFKRFSENYNSKLTTVLAVRDSTKVMDQLKLP
jgi:hypothetical protein